jgi:YVTN family beta-propeller protein
MGVVYRAFDPRLNRNVALKLLAPELAQDERFRLRFLAESQLAAALEHPHAVPVYDAGEANGQLYIVMRYVEGTDLKALLAVEAPLAAARAVEICSQVAEALDSAHARGLVHRDVKPSNVLLDEGGGVYLADFGLTRRLGDADSGVGLSLGTPAYVAPEQIEGKELDGRADQYSLGCMLFECLSGRAPFARTSEAAVLFAHLEEGPPSLSGLEEVFETALAKAPGERFPSCRDLISAARHGLGIVEPRRARWPLVAAGVGAAVLGGALLAFALERGAAHARSRVGGNAVAIIEPASDRLVGRVAAGAQPSAIVSASGSLWIANQADETVSRLDPRTGLALRTFAAGGLPTGLAVTADSVWVVSTDPNRAAVIVRRIDPRFNLVLGSRRLPNVVVGGTGSVAAQGGSVWVAPSSGLLTRLDAASGRVVERVDPQAGPAGVAVGGGGVWVTDYFANTVTEVDSAGRKHVVDVGGGPTGVAYGDRAVWVTDSLGDTVSRVDPRSRRVLHTIKVGARPVGVAVGAGAVWVANSLDGTVSRIDPSTDRVTGRVEIGGSPQAITVADGRVWVTVQPAIGGASTAAPTGGTAHLNAKGDGFSNGVNPAYQEIQYVTCADLVNYPDAPAPAGSRLVPRARHRGAHALTRRTDVHVHDPEGLPLLTAIEPTGDRRNSRLHDRAEPQP